MNRQSLKAHWLTLAGLSIFLAIGAIAAGASSTPTVASLKLSTGESAEVSIFRLLPVATQVSLEFEHNLKYERPELGKYKIKSESAHPDFEDPGQPVVIQILSPMTSEKYEALPASWSTYTKIYRKLAVKVWDPTTNMLVWPISGDSLLHLPFGLHNPGELS